MTTATSQIRSYNQEKLYAFFERAGTVRGDYESEENWHRLKRQSGIKNVKRKVLGLCGCSSLKSLDELANILVQTGVALTRDEAREIVPSLAGKSFCYGPANSFMKFFEPFAERNMSFSKVTNDSGNEVKYKVSFFPTGESG